MSDEAQNTPEDAPESTETAQEPDSGPHPTPDATGAGEALVQQIAEAIMGGKERAARLATINPKLVENAHRDARAVLPLVEAQVAPLRDEIATLREVLRIGTELDNHHNAAMCPYCKPSGQDAAESALRQVREAVAQEADALDGLAKELPTERSGLELGARSLRDLLARVGAADTQPEGAGEEVISTGHARAIVQMSEWMERAEKSEADLLDAWLAVEEVADEVDRGGSLADYIRALAAAGPDVSGGCMCPPDFCLGAEGDQGPGTAECGPCLALDPELPCLRESVSDGEGATSEGRCSSCGIGEDGDCTVCVPTPDWPETRPCLCGCGEPRPASPVVAPSATDEGGA